MSSIFSIIQSSKPVIITRNIEELQTEVKSLQIETSEQSEIPTVFMTYLYGMHMRQF
jgi:hypothetical protein